MSDVATTIADNLCRTRDRIAAAAERANRRPQDVQLVAVTKYADAALTRALVQAGADVLGESRPQELWSKSQELADLDIHWHLVGHLQRNKVARTLPLVDLIHSIDSLRLLDAINQEATQQGRRCAVLLEVNISGDETKHGFTPDELAGALLHAAEHKNVEVRGLMAMAHRVGGPDVARHDFAAVRALRDGLIDNLPDNVSLAELSLGMSADFEVAILEGATMVRVGSALFEGVIKP